MPYTIAVVLDHKAEGERGGEHVAVHPGHAVFPLGRQPEMLAVEPRAVVRDRRRRRRIAIYWGACVGYGGEPAAAAAQAAFHPLAPEIVGGVDDFPRRVVEA